ncbi:MAG TPA: methyltransferase [Fibrobacteraceae bacterium]|nr:methyltransferase [Fibrobacteraceae bacterium]
MTEPFSALLTRRNYRQWSWLGCDWVAGEPQQDGAIDLLLRQGLPNVSRLTLVNCGCGAWLSATHSAQQLFAIHPFLEDHLALQINVKEATKNTISPLNQRVDSRMADPDQLDLPPCDAVVFRIFRDMDWNDSWIQAFCASLPAGIPLHILGLNDDGIRSLERHLSKKGFPIETEAIGCHARWLRTNTRPPAGIHSGEAPILQEVSTPLGSFPFWLPEGTFAAGHLDTGTALLLEHLGIQAGNSVWDFGCGAGIIARVAVAGHAKFVYASDHASFAVRVAQRNLESCTKSTTVGLHFLGEGVPGKFSCILSNPPFHLEGRELRQLGKLWLEACKDHLEPGGEIRLVANQFLPYGQFAMDLDLSADVIAVRQGFKVWRMTKAA